MKLKAFVKSLDDVPEQYRDLYVASGDGFALQVEGVTEHPDVTALKNAHERSKARVRELTVQNETLTDQVGELPENFDRSLYDQAVANAENGGAGGKSEAEIRREASEAGKAAGRKEMQRDLDKANERADRLKTRVERDARNSAINTALDDAKVTDPALRRGAAALIGSQVKILETDSDFEVLVTDPDLGDIPVAEYVKTWAQTDEGKAYVGARSSAGGGANGSDQGGNAPDHTANNPWKRETLNVTAQMTIRRDNPTLAAKLMREAGVTLPS